MLTSCLVCMHTQGLTCLLPDAPASLSEREIISAAQYSTCFCATVHHEQHLLQVRPGLSRHRLGDLAQQGVSPRVHGTQCCSVPLICSLALAAASQAHSLHMYRQYSLRKPLARVMLPVLRINSMGTWHHCCSTSSRACFGRMDTAQTLRSVFTTVRRHTALAAGKELCLARPCKLMDAAVQVFHTNYLGSDQPSFTLNFSK